MDSLILGFFQGGAVLFLDRYRGAYGDVLTAYDRLCKVSRFLDACEGA